MIDQRLADRIRKTGDELTAKGELLTPAQLARYCDAFRARFGPEVLAGLDGEKLLETMHDNLNHDSLVYWLEFKNDEEFPALFGSIAGGSALKFKIYRRKETGAWMTGHPQKQVQLSVNEAIDVARRHREELLRGVQILTGLPQMGSDDVYRDLQEQMNREAPTIGDSAWGHKYFSVIFPEKLEDIHVSGHQRFHLIKLLQDPPKGEGRYLAGGRYVTLANDLDLPLTNLTDVLYKMNGEPHRYWRVGTSDGTKSRNRWDLMAENSAVAIGWETLGDLSWVQYKEDSRNRLRDLVQKQYPQTPQAVGRAAKQILNFVAVMRPGDLVIAADGQTVVGVGRVTEGYRYLPNVLFNHHRPVEWLQIEDWKLPEPTEGLQTTVYELNNPQNLVAIEARVLGESPLGRRTKPEMVGGAGVPTRVPALPGILGRIQTVLGRKLQVILYGPPGTGKTYWAERAARNLASYATTSRAFESLNDDERIRITGAEGSMDSNVRMCCFHPNYSYEDFIEGYRPEVADRKMGFALRDGIFKTICRDAEARPAEPFYLIIDEINRGDLPRIMGELLTVIEKGRRGQPILLPLSGALLRVPANLFVIGTMNTADRSIALLDTALRRRFGFIELLPDAAVLGDEVLEGIPLGPWLTSLNQRICQFLGRDARNLQIGHSYLMDADRPVSDFGRFSKQIQEEIVPLLEEYCYEDYTALERILGKGLVDLASQRVRHELFAPGRRVDLIQALLTQCPEITSSAVAIASEASSNIPNGDDSAREEEDPKL